MGFRTEDGELAELWQLSAGTELADQLDFRQDLDLAAMEGSFTIEDELDTQAWDEVSAWVEGPSAPRASRARSGPWG